MFSITKLDEPSTAARFEAKLSKPMLAPHMLRLTFSTR